MRKQILCVVGLLCASTALAQEFAEMAQPAPPDPALGSAVASKVLSCYAAEGGVLTDEDRQVVESFAAELGATVGAALGGGERSEGKGCVAAVAALSCADVAKRLGGDDLSGPVAPWAEAWSGALRDRVMACYAEESGGSPPSSDDKSRIEVFRLGLSRSLTALGSQGTCRVNVAGLDPCVAAVRGLRCDALSEGLGSDAESLLSSMTAACASLLECGLDILDLGL